MHSLKEEFSKLMKKLSDQERTIKSLELSNAVQKQKLAELGDGAGTVTATKKKGMPKQGSFGSKPLREHDEWALTGDRGFMPTQTSNLKGFISTQLREELKGTEPILVIDDPDSTTGGTKKKKKASRRIEESDKESNASEVLSQSQRPRAKRWHISSERSSVQGYDLLSPKGKDSEEESGDEMKNLLCECDDVEERLAEMQRKMEGLDVNTYVPFTKNKLGFKC